MNELSDSLCMDLILYGIETMTYILDSSGKGSIIIKTILLEDFEHRLENIIKKMDLVYCPSTNSFHSILEIDILDKSITIDENKKYNPESVKNSILVSGVNVGIIDKSFMETVNDLIDTNKNGFGEIYGNYIMYKAYVSHIIYEIILSYIMESPETFIPYINSNEDFAYITLSINMNSWWDQIANKRAEKIRDTTSLEEKYTILWIRPTIAVKPDMSFKISNIALVDMAPILLNNGAE